MPTRRGFLGAASALALPNLFSPARAADPVSTSGDKPMSADLILHHGLVTTLDRTNPNATALAIRDGKFLAVGEDRDIMALAGPGTKVIDLKGKRVLPGLIDNHTHVVRGGLNYNMELRWDGVRSLADAMDMLKRQVAITPPPQWVRAVGGFTEHQFVEKRLPTIDEINAVAPDTPVFLLHLMTAPCSMVPRCAPSAIQRTRRTRRAASHPRRQRQSYWHAARETQRRHPHSTLAKGPKLPFEYQVNSTRHFMRELNRLGVTGVIDAGGGYQNYPDDYAVIQKLADEGQMTVRLAYNLFTQKPREEKQDFLKWTSSVKYKQGDDYFRHNGAGEMLVFSAADFEDFRQPRPDMPPEMEGDLEEVVRVLTENRWPWRMHATYDETISRALDVFEKVNQDMPLEGLNWFFDHAETISERSIDRIAALGGGIATQHRMAYQGEYFVERYGHGAAEATPPIAKMLEKGVHVSAGTDATRVASYNPWVSLSWMITGKTLGGMQLYPRANCLDRETALRMWTENVTWFSTRKARRAGSRRASSPTSSFPTRTSSPARGRDLVSDVGTHDGRRQDRLRGGAFADFDENDVPPAMPDWSPVRTFGGYAAWGEPEGAGKRSLRRTAIATCGCASNCNVHGHDHAGAWTSKLPISDLKGFFGALGCACWAV